MNNKSVGNMPYHDASPEEGDDSDMKTRPEFFDYYGGGELEDYVRCEKDERND